MESTSAVSRGRVVGASVLPTAEPSRSTLRAGEEFDMEWHYISPPPTASKDEDRFTLAVTACVASTNRNGIPSCTRAPFLLSPAQTFETRPFRTRAQVPDAQALEGASQILLAGAFCTGDAKPLIEMTTSSTALPNFRCDVAGARIDAFTLVANIVTDPSKDNQHPSVDGAFVRLPARSASVWASSASSCDEEAVQVRLSELETKDEEQILRFDLYFDDSLREIYTPVVTGTPASPTREAWAVAQFTTASKFEGAFVVREGEEISSSPTDSYWIAPKKEAVPESGLQVRFAWLIRDGRGGMAFERRSLCLKP